VLQDGTKKKFQTLQFFLLSSKKNPEFFTAGKKFSNLPDFLKPPPRRRKNLQFPPIFFTKVFPKKKFLSGQFDSFSNLNRKKLCRGKIFSKCTHSVEKISLRLRKNIPPPKKKISFEWIEWKKSPGIFLALPFQQFQVLFYSPFEVLFIFPSQYFFAIGLLSIFSFRWITPSVLSCISKQLDSKAPKIYPRFFLRKLQGYHLLWHCVPANLFSQAWKIQFLNATIHSEIFPKDFQHELFHFHSQLLMKS